MKKQNFLWVDVIRVIATFSVIWLHSAAPLLYKYNELPTSDWWAGNIYDSLVRMCVPLFFILSGSLLLEKKENISIFFTKRISKVFLPLIIWSILYILWKMYYEGSSSISFYSFYSLALTPAYYHLWFLYAIIGLYLYVPILRVLVQNSNNELLYYFIALWFFAVSIVPIFEKITHIDNRIDLKMISGYVGYLVIGHLLGNMRATRKKFYLSLLIFVFTVVVTAVMTYVFTVKNEGVFFGYFYSYLSPNIIIMSVSVFISIKYFSENARIFESILFQKLIRSLSSASLGIYLIHTMVLFVLKKGDFGISLSSFSYSAIYAVPITAITTFSLSFFIIYFIKKIPIIKQIAP